MKTKKPYVERALFIIGEKDAGKSKQIHSVLRDWRLHKEGKVPRKKTRRIPETYALSNERWLYVRTRSYFEIPQSLDDFLDECAAKMKENEDLRRRWNFLGALRPDKEGKRLSAACVIESFAKHFSVERTRAVILLPYQNGKSIKPSNLTKLIANLRAKNVTDVLMVDATSRVGNGLIYADFFDFT
jgi:hypothetical protein